MGPRENQSLKKFPLGYLVALFHPPGVGGGVCDPAPGLVRPSRAPLREPGAGCVGQRPSERGSRSRCPSGRSFCGCLAPNVASRPGYGAPTAGRLGAACVF